MKVADDLAILRALRRGEALFPHELEQATGATLDRIGDALLRLQEAGRVTEAIPDLWMLTTTDEQLGAVRN